MDKEFSTVPGIQLISEEFCQCVFFSPISVPSLSKSVSYPTIISLKKLLVIFFTSLSRRSKKLEGEERIENLGLAN